MGWTSADLGFVFSAYTWGTCLWAPIVGWVCDRIGNRKTIIVGLILSTAGALLLATVQNIWQVYLYYSFFIGFSVSMTLTITVQSLIRKWFMRKAGTASGILNAVTAAAAALLLPLLTGIAAAWGWRPTLAVATVLMQGIGVFFAFFVIRDTPESKGLNVDGVSDEELQKIRAALTSRGPAVGELSMTRNEAMKTPQFWLNGVAQGVQSAAAAGIIGQITMIALSVGLPAAQTGTAATAFMVPSILGRLAGGWLGDKFGKRQTIIVSGIASATIMLGGYLFAKNVVTMYVFLALAGLAMMTGTVLYPPAWGDMFGRRNLSGIMGIAGFVSGLIYGIGPLLSGLISQSTGSYNIFFLTLSGFYIVQVILILLKKPTRIELVNMVPKNER